MKMNNLLNIVSIIASTVGTIVALIGIVVTVEGIQARPEPEQPTYTVGNIVAGEGATVNINCTVTP